MELNDFTIDEIEIIKMDVRAGIDAAFEQINDAPPEDTIVLRGQINERRALIKKLSRDMKVKAVDEARRINKEALERAMARAKELEEQEAAEAAAKKPKKCKTKKVS